MITLRHFTLAISNTKNVSEQYRSVHNVFQQIWCNLYDQFFVGPKNSRTKLFKVKAIVPKKTKRFWPIFLLLPTMTDIEYFLLGSTKYLDNRFASYKIISLGPKRLFKTHILWKKANFSLKKIICPIIFRIVECGKPQETINKSQKDFLTINVEVKGPFFRTWQVVENTKLWKERLFF